MPGALRSRARVPRRVRRRLRPSADTRARPRLLHAHDVRIQRRGDRCEGHDLWRRALRRLDRGDRRAGDARHRLRRWGRAAPALARRRAARSAEHRRLFRLRARRRPQPRPSVARGAAAARPQGRHGLRRPLAERPARSGRAASCGVDGHRRRQPRDGARAGPRRLDRAARRAGRQDLGMNRWRDMYCGAARPDDVGRTIAVAGWVARRRDHGGLIFIDLRDHTGIVQLVVNPERAPKAARTAHDIRSEFVVRAQGEIVRRGADAVNPNIPTGEVELQVNELEIVSRSEPLPFQIDDEGVEEPIRLRYRYLDLRRERMQRNLRLSATVIGAIRRSMEEQGFIDVWTPSMTLGTPEGARDFLIPMRLQPGRFYALAQSPQLFKQLFMVGGLDRYYQIATAWRDEDLRADRQFEFRQLDLELAFPTREDVLDVLERVVVVSFESLGRTPPPRPFPRMSYADAMLRYGSDKPDVRFGLEIQDATEVTRGSDFGVFASAETVRFLVAPTAFS